jgi:hypothetical protein
MNGRTRRSVLGIVGGGVLGTAGCLGTDGGAGSTDGTGDDGTETAWRTAELTDVTTDETFTIADIDSPVLVHPFAIWCSICNSQNEEIDALQQAQPHKVVQLNIGDDEGRDDVAAYAMENGYADHSRFAVAPAGVAGALVDEFGPTAVSPPQSPVIVVCPDGSARELDKVASPETIETTVETSCE